MVNSFFVKNNIMIYKDPLLSDIPKLGFTFIDDIVRLVSEKTNIPEEIIKSKERKREVLQPRQICHKLAKTFTNSSLETIGQKVGQKDHATVLNSIKTVNNYLDTEIGFRSLYNSIEMEVRMLALNRTKNYRVCAMCGSSDLVATAYISLETMNVIGTVDYDDIDKIYCRSCKENTVAMTAVDYDYYRSYSEKV